MAFHRCTIHDEKGTVVCENVSLTVEEADRDGTTHWYGTVSVMHTTPLMPGPTYRIVLDNGKKGEFHVRRNTMAGGAHGTERAVAIDGMGKLA